MQKEIHKLDSPAWHSLSETHRDLAIGYGYIKFYDPGYCPFGGFLLEGDYSGAMEQYAMLASNFFVIGQEFPVPPGLVLKQELVCLQMLMDKPAELEMQEEITGLQPAQHAELRQLVNLVQPGYFRERTPLMGDYFGIYKEGELVAVTGERMKMEGYTEVSAVVTHPAHTGRGYAKQLVARTAEKIFGENRVPYLHVAESNRGAIALYEKLGFRVRRKISFWNLVKQTAEGSDLI